MTESAVATEAQNQQDTQTEEHVDVPFRQAESVELTEVQEKTVDGPGTSLDVLLDMEVSVTVVIGQARIPIQRLLQLNPGSVMKLDKPIDRPVELYLKDAKFATGDIVVVDDKFAVRIKEILNAAGGLKK